MEVGSSQMLLSFKHKIYSFIAIFLFIVYFSICIHAYVKGDKSSLYPYDEDGNFCGFGGLADYDKVYLYGMLPYDVYNRRACVSECPKKFNGFIKSFPTEGQIGEIDISFFYSSIQCKYYFIITHSRTILRLGKLHY